MTAKCTHWHKCAHETQTKNPQCICWQHQHPHLCHPHPSTYLKRCEHSPHSRCPRPLPLLWTGEQEGALPRRRSSPHSCWNQQMRRRVEGCRTCCGGGRWRRDRGTGCSRPGVGGGLVCRGLPLRRSQHLPDSWRSGLGTQGDLLTPHTNILINHSTTQRYHNTNIYRAPSHKSLERLQRYKGMFHFITHTPTTIRRLLVMGW